MTWVIWRQYRVTAAIAGAVLATFAVLFLITGLHDAAQWHAALAGCARNGTCDNLSRTVSLASGPVYALTSLTLAVPLLFGMFWAAPQWPGNGKPGPCSSHGRSRSPDGAGCRSRPAGCCSRPRSSAARSPGSSPGGTRR